MGTLDPVPTVAPTRAPVRRSFHSLEHTPVADEFIRARARRRAEALLDAGIKPTTDLRPMWERALHPIARAR